MSIGREKNFRAWDRRREFSLRNIQSPWEAGEAGEAFMANDFLANFLCQLGLVGS
ncbi:hypothetical protein NIES23_46440 [Trichormus variabilis NIES-23]|uniref:Uncharacterized protein n=1 Tax=Trichormus variabilis NIES-23 TaxID=1973479 RepID=A0A1Z4KSH4_ANAVA|nr:hypothetical protein NIES23_46440 [Trichormus variabilis NIES-23]